MDRKKVIIADDERGARKLIKEYLSEYPAFEVIGEASNGFEAVEMISREQPDVVFLDIQMPGYNGFEVLTQLEEIPEIVFSTAFDSFALKAFEVHAVDYLLKPYTKDRFAKAIEKLKTKSTLFNLITLTESLHEKQQKFATRIFATKQRKLIPIEPNEIAYIEAYGDFCKIFVASNSFTSNYGISALQEKLNPDLFLRIHRSNIVNIQQIQEIRKSKSSYVLILKNGSEIPASRRNAAIIRKLKI